MGGEAPGGRDGERREALPLREAVAAFNREARADPVGKSQPPLTEEEVVAAIRGWDRERIKAPDVVYAAFQRIAETRRLPEGAALYFLNAWKSFRGFDFDVWWVDLSIPTGPLKGYVFRIRDRKLRSRPASRR